MKKSKLRVNRLIAAVLVSPTLVLSTPVIAQEQAEVDSAQEDQDSGSIIIVTARKRDENLQDVPVVVSVLQGEQLDQFGITNLEDIATQTVGLYIGEGNSNTGGNIALRGISTANSTPVLDQSIAIVLDNAALTHGVAMRVSQIDVERVEVLKGPQALFFGKNSPGGVISFTTKGPGDEFEGSISGGYEFKAREKFVEAALGGPLSDSLGVRVVARYSDMDGFLVNTAGPVTATVPGVGTFPVPGAAQGSRFSRLPVREDFFIRGTVEAEIGNRFSATAKVSYYKSDGSSYYSLPQLSDCPFGVGQYQLAFGFQEDCVLNDRVGAGDVNSASAAALGAPDLGNDSDVDWFLASLTMNYELTDALDLVSVTSYLDQSDDQLSGTSNTAALVGAYIGLDKSTFSQELRLVSNFDGPLNFLLGGYYADDQNDLFVGVYFTDPTLPPPFGPNFAIPPGRTRQIVDTQALSAFGQVIFDVSDTVELSGGLRWSQEKKDWRGFDGLANPVQTFNVVADSATFDNLSPEATITFRPTENSTYFASYKQGFKSGGFQVNFLPGGFDFFPPAPPTFMPVARPPVDLIFDQEEVEGFEIGAKWLFAGGDLALNAAAYLYDYSDLQVARFNPTTGTPLTTNAASASVRGFEIEAIYQPSSIEGLRLHAGMNYNKAEYEQFISDCFTGQLPTAGCNLVQPNGAPGQDSSGAPLVFAPEWSANLGVAYSTPIGNGIELSTGWTLEYSSSFQTSFNNNPRLIQGDFARINGQIGIKLENGLRISLVGKNLTDKYVSGLSVDVTGTGTLPGGPPTLADTYTVAQRGRQVLVEVGFDF